MLKHIIAALVVLIAFSALASDNTTTNLPADTIIIQTVMRGEDVVNVRRDKVWFTHVEGDFPSNIRINGKSWIPIWENERDSDIFTMKEPPRFLPMKQRSDLIFVSSLQTNVLVEVIEYPDDFNGWVLEIFMKNMNDSGSAETDAVISWEEDTNFIDRSRHFLSYVKPSPTPVGLR